MAQLFYLPACHQGESEALVRCLHANCLRAQLEESIAYLQLCGEYAAGIGRAPNYAIPGLWALRFMQFVCVELLRELGDE